MNSAALLWQKGICEICIETILFKVNVSNDIVQVFDLCGDMKVDPGAASHPTLNWCHIAPHSQPMKHLSCSLMNARSIVNNSFDLHAYLETAKPDNVTITFTYLDELILDSEMVDDIGIRKGGLGGL